LVEIGEKLVVYQAIILVRAIRHYRYGVEEKQSGEEQEHQ
jgi:hypothetical protein